jgi:hypothetical protein
MEHGLQVTKSQCEDIQMFTRSLLGTKLTFLYLSQQVHGAFVCPEQVK